MADDRTERPARLPARRWARGGLLVAAAMLPLVAGGCGRPKPPIVRVHDIELSEVTFQSIRSVFVVEILNVNTFAVHVKGLDYQVLAGGEPFAAGEVNESLTIGPQSAAYVRAPVEIDYRKLLGIVRVARQSQGAFAYELAGRTRVDVMGMDVSVPLRHKGRIARPPSWRLSGVRLGEGYSVELVFEVTNPNDFPLPVVGVTGELRYGGQTVMQLARCPESRLPASSTSELVIPVRVEAPDLTRLAAAMASGQKPRFEGDFKLAAPTSIRKLLMGVDE